MYLLIWYWDVKRICKMFVIDGWRLGYYPDIDRQSCKDCVILSSFPLMVGWSRVYFLAKVLDYKKGRFTVRFLGTVPFLSISFGQVVEGVPVSKTMIIKCINCGSMDENTEVSYKERLTHKWTSLRCSPCQEYYSKTGFDRNTFKPSCESSCLHVCSSHHHYVIYTSSLRYYYFKSIISRLLNIYRRGFWVFQQIGTSMFHIMSLRLVHVLEDRSSMLIGDWLIRTVSDGRLIRDQNLRRSHASQSNFYRKIIQRISHLLIQSVEFMQKKILRRASSLGNM